MRKSVKPVRPLLHTATPARAQPVPVPIYKARAFERRYSVGRQPYRAASLCLEPPVCLHFRILFVFLILAWPITDTPLVWLLPARAIANSAARSQYCSTARFCMMLASCHSSLTLDSLCCCACVFVCVFSRSIVVALELLALSGWLAHWLTSSLASCWFAYALGPNHRRSLSVTFSLWVSLDSARCVLGSVRYYFFDRLRFAEFMIWFDFLFNY